MNKILRISMIAVLALIANFSFGQTIFNFDNDYKTLFPDLPGVSSSSSHEGDLSKACESMDVHIAGVNTQKGKDGELIVVLSLSIEDTAQMQKLLRTLKNIQGVEEVYRTKS